MFRMKGFQLHAERKMFEYFFCLSKTMTLSYDVERIKSSGADEISDFVKGSNMTLYLIYKNF